MADFQQTEATSLDRSENSVDRIRLIALNLCHIALALIIFSVAVQKAVAATYDKPVKILTAQSDVGELKCTFYPDLMIRENGVDQAGPDAAILVPEASPGMGCNRAHLPGEKTLPTSAESFNGRRGSFLIFSQTDPSNAIGFAVLSTSGAVLYTDDMMDSDFQLAEIENGALHLIFRRGINSTCSVLSDSTCWKKLGEAKMLPHVISAAGPPIKACEASYAAQKSPDNDPSVIFYPVDMTISISGHPSVKSRGKAGCQPAE